MNKSQAIKLLQHEGWTKADASRALESVDFSANPDELTIRRVTSPFAGPELSKRQNLQRAQKGLVKKKTDEMERRDKEHASKIEKHEKDLREERGFWRGLVGRVYDKARELGSPKDPMVEHVLKEDDDDNKVA